MSRSLYEPRIPASNSHLYKQLLELVPALPSLNQHQVAIDVNDDTLTLSVIGKRDDFRRLRLERLNEDEHGDFLPAPCIEIIARVDLKCAQVVTYEDAFIFSRVFRSGSDNPCARADRLISRFLHSFLDEILSEGCSLRPIHNKFI